jgi:3-mercaptopyruvate sulfurtransferase SseA
MCDGGYQSSLAAATLQRLGLHDATDIDGGFQAWRAAGLPSCGKHPGHAHHAEPRSTPMPDPNEDQSAAEAAEPQETAEAKQEGKDRGGEQTPPEPGGGKPQDDAS